MAVQQRYVLAFMGFLAVAIGYFMRMSFNLAIVVMAHRVSKTVDLNACPGGESHSSSSSTHYEFDWSDKTQGYILSSFYWGYVVGHIPAGLLAQKFGGKQTLGMAILICGIITTLTPVIAYQGPIALIVLRVLLGLGEGAMFPGLNQLLAAWIPLSERGKIGSFVFAGVTCGSMFSMILTGYILGWTNNYWPLVFYVFGSMGIIWSIFWYFICFSDPGSHPFISQKEKDFLQERIGSLGRRKDLPSTPWKAILTSPPVIALIIIQMGHDLGLFTINTDLPKYMSSVLHFSIKQNGLLSALPFLFMFLFALGSGWLSDKLVVCNTFSLTTNRKIFTTFGSVGPGLGIILASFAGCNKALVVFFFTFGMGMMGFYYPSIKVNTLDLSLNYSGVLMGLVNGVGALSGIAAPIMVGYLCPDNTVVQWRLVFWITFVVLVVTNIVFIIWGSAKVQPWNGESLPPPAAEAEPRVIESE